MRMCSCSRILRIYSICTDVHVLTQITDYVLIKFVLSSLKFFQIYLIIITFVYLLIIMNIAVRQVSILRVFISFTKQFFTFHSNRVKCEKQILSWVGFEPTTSCICGRRLTARPRGPHGRERTTPRLK